MKRTRSIPIILGAIVLLLAIYIGSYHALLRSDMKWMSAGTTSRLEPWYVLEHKWLAWALRPAHLLDRRIRRDHWDGAEANITANLYLLMGSGAVDPSTFRCPSPIDDPPCNDRGRFIGPRANEHAAR